MPLKNSVTTANIFLQAPFSIHRSGSVLDREISNLDNLNGVVPYIIAVILGFYMISFLAIAASKESACLTRNFGESFIQYREHVYPFLAIRKYFKTSTLV